MLYIRYQVSIYIYIYKINTTVLNFAKYLLVVSQVDRIIPFYINFVI